jgi:predicted esterase
MKPVFGSLGFRVGLWLIGAGLWGVMVHGAGLVPPTGLVIPMEDRQALRLAADRLAEELEGLRSGNAMGKAWWPDVAVFLKAVDWALRFDEFQHTNEVAEARRILDVGFARAASLREGRADWLTATGRVVRGFVSRVDGSVQPYGVVVGPEYRPGGRLDVWLHGRDDKLTELRFVRDRMRSDGEFAPADAVVVHPYGRFCNAFKFAGETDVLEATEAARRAYGADPARMAIRGFSMGGAGVWHVAVHHPGLWRAAAPGAGFAETAEYTGVLAKEPGLPEWERRLWRWYDATEWAANLRQVPLLAYSGEKDRQIQAARVMERAMQAEGMRLEHLIGPGVEHRYEPETKKELARRVDEWMRLALPGWTELDLICHTLRYPAGEGGVWLRFEALETHWEPSRLNARRDGADRIMIRTQGVRSFSVGNIPDTPAGGWVLEVDGQTVRGGVGGSVGAGDAAWRRLERVGGGWRWARGLEVGEGKRRGLQGPIDDAFLDPFLVVVPSGKSRRKEVDDWVQASLERFLTDWRAQFRGEPRVCRDVEVSAADLERYHVVVWGDPDSNRLLGRMRGRLPVRWDRRGIRVGGTGEVMEGEVASFIAPNPLNPDRYVVVNSGHTFAAWDGTNARQTPRLPDWAVWALDGEGARVMRAGFFGEDWK